MKHIISTLHWSLVHPCNLNHYLCQQSMVKISNHNSQAIEETCGKNVRYFLFDLLYNIQIIIYNWKQGNNQTDKNKCVNN